MGMREIRRHKKGKTLNKNKNKKKRHMKGMDNKNVLLEYQILKISYLKSHKSNRRIIIIIT